MPPKPEQIGVFSPGGWGKGQEPYEAWLGRQVGWVVDNADENKPFRDMKDPTKLNDSMKWHVGSLASSHANTPANLILGIPLLSRDVAGQFKEANAGTFDGIYHEWAKALAPNRIRLLNGVALETVLRPDWERNGSWMPFYAGKTPEQTQGSVELNRRFVRIVRQYNPDFKFSFCTTLGPQGMSDASLAYPGKEYCDYIDLDVYDENFGSKTRTPDQRFDQDYLNGTNRLNWWRDFAAKEGKPLAFSEWGVGKNDGADNPRFIERFAQFVDQTPNVAWACYFERLKSALADGTKPLSAAAYKRLFGPQPVVVVPPKEKVEITGMVVGKKTFAGTLYEQ